MAYADYNDLLHLTERHISGTFMANHSDCYKSIATYIGLVKKIKGSYKVHYHLTGDPSKVCLLFEYLSVAYFKPFLHSDD